MIDFPSFVAENESLRLADFLRRKLHISKYHIRRCLQKEWITVNQLVQTHKSTRLSIGDVVAVNATAFQIAKLRFAEPLLRTIYNADGDDGDINAGYSIFYKPAGMPLDGDDSETVENALPALMDNEHYNVVDLVGRITSGPIIVSLNNAAHQRIIEVPKRYTFQLIVHGIPPVKLELEGFVSLTILETVQSTTGDLSMIQVILMHSGNGLRGCLKRIDRPILGTSFSTKSTMNGCFFACTKLELLWKDGNNVDGATTTTVGIQLPEKFHTVIERERRFYDVKKQREAEEEDKQHQLRREYVEQRKGMTSEDLLSNDWCIASFCGLSFYITDDVMTPKPSSEVLVQTTTDYLLNTEADFSILDLGIGSGCLLLSALINARHNGRGIGVDISADALKIAKINIDSYDLSDRIELFQGDFGDLSFLGNSHTNFDVILCNPPYLTENECKKDRPLGPRVALVAENRGLACYESISRQVGSFLKPDGVVILEVGGKRKVEEICAIFRDFDHVETRPDGQRNGRCLVLRKSITRHV